MASPILRNLPLTTLPSLRKFPANSLRLHAAPLGQCLAGLQLPTPLRSTVFNASLRSGSENGGLRGLDVSRVRAVGDGGSGGGGIGGGGGGSGNGGAGGGGDESGNGNGNDDSFFSWYLSALDKHPIITKAITSAVLTLIGDLICQLVIDKVAKLDLRRTFVFTFLGLALVGPTLHVWYLYLSKLVTLQGASGVVARLCLDQFLFSPAFIGLFMALLVTFEGKPSNVMPKLKQVLGANFVALAWNVILSFKAHKEVIVKEVKFPTRNAVNMKYKE